MASCSGLNSWNYRDAYWHGIICLDSVTLITLGISKLPSWRMSFTNLVGTPDFKILIRDFCQMLAWFW